MFEPLRCDRRGRSPPGAACGMVVLSMHEHIIYTNRRVKVVTMPTMTIFDLRKDFFFYEDAGLKAGWSTDNSEQSKLNKPKITFCYFLTNILSGFVDCKKCSIFCTQVTQQYRLVF